MQKADYFVLGIISKKHGYKGDAIISITADYPEQYTKLESVFIEFNKNLVPFFFTKTNLQAKGKLRIHFEDIDSEEDLLPFLKKTVYLHRKHLPEPEEGAFFYQEIIGFNVIDKTHGELGQITGINGSYQQDFFVIESKDKKEILIPVVDDWILKINKEEKYIQINTPEGLIDVYL